MNPSHSLPAKPPGVARPASNFPPRSNTSRNGNFGQYPPAAQGYGASAPQYGAAPGVAQGGNFAQNQYGNGYGQAQYGQYNQQNQYGSYGASSGYGQNVGGNFNYGSQNKQGFNGAYGQQGQQEQVTQTPEEKEREDYERWKSAYNSQPSKDDKSFPGTQTHVNANTIPVAAPKDASQSRRGNATEDHKSDGWDPSQWRIFVGNLAGEVTDDTLLKAFSKYPSANKARVVRDAESTKSKGFGFVQFKNSEDVLHAVKHMEMKYIGSHPVKLKMATSHIDEKDPFKTKQFTKHHKAKDTKPNPILPRAPKFKKNKGKYKGQNKSGDGVNDPNGQEAQGAYDAQAQMYTEAMIHANTHSGIKKGKKAKRTKDGLEILG